MAVFHSAGVDNKFPDRRFNLPPAPLLIYTVFLRISRRVGNGWWKIR